MCFASDHFHDFRNEACIQLISFNNGTLTSNVSNGVCTKFHCEGESVEIQIYEFSFTCGPIDKGKKLRKENKPLGTFAEIKCPIPDICAIRK